MRIWLGWDGCGRGSEVASRTRTAARFIDCAGHGCDITRNTALLLRKLFRFGLYRPNVLRLGLDATGEGTLPSAAGIASDRLFGSVC